MKPGPIYIRDHHRTHKNAPPVIEGNLLHANPQYAHVQLPSGVETTVNIRDISQHPASIDEEEFQHGDYVDPASSNENKVEDNNVEFLNLDERSPNKGTISTSPLPNQNSVTLSPQPNVTDISTCSFEKVN